jgi:hypothetical protein
VKFKNKLRVIFAKYMLFTVNPNIDPDPKFDSNIFVFVLLFVDYVSK